MPGNKATRHGSRHTADGAAAIFGWTVSPFNTLKHKGHLTFAHDRAKMLMDSIIARRIGCDRSSWTARIALQEEMARISLTADVPEDSAGRSQPS
jgi:hypothetical protein